MFIKPKEGREATALKKIEVVTVVLGFLFSSLYLIASSNIQYNADWNAQLYNDQVHTPIAPSSLPSVIVVAVIAMAGYAFLRFVPLKKQPHLLTVLCIAAMYLGIVECILWCIQIGTGPRFYPLCLFPANCVLLAIRTIRDLVSQKKQPIEARKEYGKNPRLT